MTDNASHAPRYWIIVASRDHVQRGVRGDEGGSFAQANHGKAAPLKRLRAGDWVIYYSSRAEAEKDTPLQTFTAIGTVKDDEVYAGEMSRNAGDFKPARRRIDFRACEEVPIRPLIDQLSFIADKAHWGAPFRFGMLEIPRADFERIAGQMLPGAAL